VVHRAFAPSDDDLARARALLASVDAHGESAYRDADGRFVDPAVVAGARAVLDRTRPEPRETP
jgi:citrate lyase subunit beta / citryl-CoA lyase